jgi:chromosome segregation ATPase
MEAAVNEHSDRRTELEGRCASLEAAAAAAAEQAAVAEAALEKATAELKALAGSREAKGSEVASLQVSVCLRHAVKFLRRVFRCRRSKRGG